MKKLMMVQLQQKIWWWTTDVNQPAGADMEVEDPLHGGVPGPQDRLWEQVSAREDLIRSSVRRSQALDDVPACLKKPRVQFMVKRCISEKGKEKQLEKELPWGLIPPDEREMYREAELKQWQEHVEFGAVRPLSLSESEEVRRRVSPDRILRSRFAYKDKNYAKRKCDPSVPAKPKGTTLHRWDIVTLTSGELTWRSTLPLPAATPFFWRCNFVFAEGGMSALGISKLRFWNGVSCTTQTLFLSAQEWHPFFVTGSIGRSSQRSVWFIN